MAKLKADDTATQYARISGNWRRYYLRLTTHKDRRGVVNVDELLELHDRQNGLCSLTGMPLTCDLKVGDVSLTNSSLDRIVPGSTYHIKNLRLVCRIANIMKWNMNDLQLVEMCRRIVEHAERT